MSSVVCRTCGMATPIDEMAICRRSGKPRDVCKHCERKRTAERNVQYRARNKSAINARLAMRRASVKEKS